MYVEHEASVSFFFSFGTSLTARGMDSWREEEEGGEEEGGGSEKKKKNEEKVRELKKCKRVEK